MNMDLHKTIDSVQDGTKEIAETAHVKLNHLHENYISKVIPDCGKYGDAAKFAAEMLPGVSEYNAIREGDWQAFAIAAGIDVAMLAVGAATAGVGYAALKGGEGAAKVGVKTAAKELAEAGAKKATKELAEAGAEKIVKEAAEAGVEKLAREVTDEVAEKAVKEATNSAVEHLDDVARVFKNKMDGLSRETEVLEKLISKFGENNVIREAYLRDASGAIIKDTVDNTARRIDFVIKQGDSIVKSIEVTSETASKVAQTAKELRILEQAQKTGGAFIKDPLTGNLLKFAEDIATEIWRLK